ncbi:MAG: DUF3368 domain-containing protein [Desulfobacteraceae bacterium]|nr:DUF3368 domain-containing protein [Desulfobacteraceae bacterium]
MILVSNTGPLIALAKIGKIELLRKLNYEFVCVPPIVHKELWGKVGPESKAIESSFDSFIKVITPKPLQVYVEIAILELDDGEKQVISLGLSVEEPLLLLDDKAGRNAAENLGLSVIGTAGILIAAKHFGLIDKVIPLIDEIRQKGYWLSDALVANVRKLANE